ncbi:MAG: alpha/beta fold hydrolase [Planctomycetes bacterium]|nr:alpha/beta fold hydrolase [Planctomycetota bacterium]
MGSRRLLHLLGESRQSERRSSPLSPAPAPLGNAQPCTAAVPESRFARPRTDPWFRSTRAVGVRWESPSSSPPKSMRTALILVAALAAPIVSSASSAHSPGGHGPAVENVHIKAKDEVALEGSFYKPTAAQSPAVLLIHDAGASRAQLDPLADKLNKQGFAVLTLDLRGHGASKAGALDWDKLSDVEKKGTWSSAAQDLDAAATWILSQTNVRSTSLSLVGYGAGCALAVRHAKGDENVVCMALLAPNAADYGIDVRSDIQTLAGLPTYVVTSKDHEGERLAQEANASSGNPYVELFISPPKVASPLEDKNVPAKVAKWLADKVLPKKGR